ncbi:MAG: peroxiredoxin [Pseudomonadota bacterium]|jgi:peroxiredoxin Q/BCP
MLQPGDPAPPFELPDADLEIVTLAQFRDRAAVVLYFYPKDHTPGCTMQAVEFSERMDDFERAGAVVLGVSRDDVDSHGDFRDRHSLAVRLLSDADLEVSRAYGVVQRRPLPVPAEAGSAVGVGSTAAVAPASAQAVRESVLRSTFVIDRKGVVREALYGVGARGHAEAMLARVKAMRRG